jgi:hypothetical protein
MITNMKVADLPAKLRNLSTILSEAGGTVMLPCNPAEYCLGLAAGIEAALAQQEEDKTTTPVGQEYVDGTRLGIAERAFVSAFARAIGALRAQAPEEDSRIRRAAAIAIAIEEVVRVLDDAPPSAPVGQELDEPRIGASTHQQVLDALEDAHDLSGPVHERIKKLIEQRSKLASQAVDLENFRESVLEEYASAGSPKTVEPTLDTPKQAVNQWQPIETAPKDGTVIIVTGAPELGYTLPCVVDALYDDGGWQVNQWESPSFAITPTHWMPIPPIDQKAGGAK